MNRRIYACVDGVQTHPHNGQRMVFGVGRSCIMVGGVLAVRRLASSRGSMMKLVKKKDWPKTRTGENVVTRTPIIDLSGR